MLVFQLAGEASITALWNDAILNTATKLDAALLHPPSSYWTPFTSGDAGLLKGARLTSASNAGVVQVTAVVLTVGALTGAGQGILFFDKVSGEIAKADVLKIGGSSGTAECTAKSAALSCPMLPATSAFISVETNAIRMCASGTSPTNSAGTPAGFGHYIFPTQSFSMSGWSTMKNFSMINAISGTLAVVTVTIQF